MWRSGRLLLPEYDTSQQGRPEVNTCADTLASPIAHKGGQSAALSPSILSGTVALFDALILVVTGLAAYALHPGWSEVNSSLYLSTVTVITLLAESGFYVAGLYRFEAIIAPRRQLKRLMALSTALFVGLMAVAFALKVSTLYSRVWVFAWFCALLAGLLMARLLWHVFLRQLARSERLTRNIAIVGAGEQAVRLVALLTQQDAPWNRIVGIFDDRSTRVPEAIGPYRLLGDTDRLIQYARGTRIDDVLIALPWWAEERMLQVLHKLQVLPAHIYLSPDLTGLNFPRSRYTQDMGLPLLNVFQKPLDGWSWVLKVIEDRFLALLLLVLVAPVMLVIAAAVKLDSRGPVLFRQKRYGYNNNLIEVYKFRTMYQDQCDQNADALVRQRDPRVTRVGAWLRRTSLDELPQLLNVLRGEMSIVGPRPHATRAKAAGRFYEDVVREYALRHRVKPGITGWAQVNGWRGETDTEESIRKRVEFDLQYIESWSLSLDLEILLRTLMVVLRGQNAY